MARADRKRRVRRETPKVMQEDLRVVADLTDADRAFLDWVAEAALRLYLKAQEPDGGDE